MSTDYIFIISAAIVFFILFFLFYLQFVQGEKTIINEQAEKELLNMYNKRNEIQGKKIVKNDNFILTLNAKEKKISCINCLNAKMFATVKWEKQIDYMKENAPDKTFEQIYNCVCAKCSSKAKYSDVLLLLQQHFKYVDVTNEKVETNNNTGKNNTSNWLLNINEASEEKLSKLPGINIATAKKIIERIELKGDFSTIEEMFEEMHIKEHFRNSLSTRICARPVEKNEIKVKKNSDRVIDI